MGSSASPKASSHSYTSPFTTLNNQVMAGTGVSLFPGAIASSSVAPPSLYSIGAAANVNGSNSGFAIGTVKWSGYLPDDSADTHSGLSWTAGDPRDTSSSQPPFITISKSLNSEPPVASPRETLHGHPSLLDDPTTSISTSSNQTTTEHTIPSLRTSPEALSMDQPTPSLLSANMVPYGKSDNDLTLQSPSSGEQWAPSIRLTENLLNQIDIQSQTISQQKELIECLEREKRAGRNSESLLGQIRDCVQIAASTVASARNATAVASTAASLGSFAWSLL